MDSTASDATQTVQPLRVKYDSPSPQSVASHVKTVYLVRHAESIENEKLGSLKRWAKTWSRQDFWHGVSLWSEPNMADTPLSQKGRQQVETLSSKLRKDDFLKTQGVEVVLHSPLERARETCDGVVGSDSDNTYPREELVDLREKTVGEWVPGFKGSLDERIASFERALCARKEERILVVGHSQFFRHMLGMAEKFKNCDVWKVELSRDTLGRPIWSNPENVVSVFDEVPGELVSAPALT
mmetsp:Transcript_13765/g.26703  ORF Transcript_13765/g.26703 Transcript_13765/m.26703 type:complete len:240 (-) Transcript_13765:360-1079(-)|eukprot:CAMPEP_0171578624 /NCGR_PEP_ID=MMETSP0961-20121227/7965_1 /TAXON_ID=87120 /ORGANISM="Aurantiochytrium limacinum, Strain ATCCMYA-1381" /LENGTH=239 /DNA_ID=CAMNT_0012134969 /DNA_START=31 /DNA_END=750 /DNA_ORIENTATION=-